MKSLTMLALGLAAVTAAPLAATAQEENAAAKPKLQANVVIGSKGGRIAVLKAAGKDKFEFMRDDQLMQMDVGKCGMFMLLTPEDMASAMNAYRGNELAEARKKFASVKTKYADYLGLPGNPAADAALYEIRCAVRMMDWAAAKQLANAVPHPDYLDDNDKALIAVAKALGNIPAGKLDAQKKALAAILQGPEGKALTMEEYGWIRYALARAYEAHVPAEALDGTVTAEQAPELAKAVDNYCQAALSTHGGHMEIPLDAMQRALRILWAMPGVKDETKAGPGMTAQRWNAAPVDFKDAVVLAYLLKNVYTHDHAETLEQKKLILDVAKYYYNVEKDKPAEEPKKEEGGQQEG